MSGRTGKRRWLVPALTAAFFAAAVLVPSALAGGPANDSFANAQAISGASGTMAGSNVGASSESGEPAHAGVTGGASVWYRWTAPSSGTAAFTTAGSSFDTVLAVYTGTSLGSLTQVAASDDVSGTDRTSAVTFAAVGGTTYLLAVDGFRGPVSGQAAGTISLDWSLVTASLANDDFAAAQSLSGASGTVNGSNTGASKETGEPDHLAGNAGGASVWYRWTAPSSGTATFTTESSSFDTVLAVYFGTSLGSLAQLGANDDVSVSDRQSSVTFTAVGGESYEIAVDGYLGPLSGLSTGALTLGWSLAAAAVPANDAFANAQVLNGSCGQVSGTNLNASKEPGEPNHANNPGGASVWYSWTAPATGTATVTTAGSSFDTELAVYTGSSVGGLTLVASNDDVGFPTDLTSSLDFAAVAGTTYRIAVDGYYGPSHGLHTGSIVLNWCQKVPPPPPPPPPTCPSNSITSNFNGTAIPGGSTIWFNAVLKVSGASAGSTITFRNQTLQFGGNTVQVPDATVAFTSSGRATTSFTGGSWLTTVPGAFGDNVFLSGLAYDVPSGLPGGISPVVWQGDFTTPPGVSLSWQWAAAVYRSFGSYDSLGVKPTHSTNLDNYPGGDQAGTPENFAGNVTGGARGGGGANATGSYSATGHCG